MADLDPEEAAEVFGEEWMEVWAKPLSPFQARMLAAMDRQMKRYIPGGSQDDKAIADITLDLLKKLPAMSVAQLKGRLGRKGYAQDDIKRVIKHLIDNENIIPAEEGPRIHLYLREQCERNEEDIWIPTDHFNYRKRNSVSYQRHCRKRKKE